MTTTTVPNPPLATDAGMTSAAAGFKSNMTTTDSPTVARRGSRVSFELSKVVGLEATRTWDMLTNWAGHADWVAMTTVDVDPDDPNRFTAWSGPIRALSLEDRMVAVESEFDAETGRGRCLVHKLGPVLVGEAEFTVEPGTAPGTSVVHWREDVHVPYLPSPLTGPVGRLGALFFGRGLVRMEKVAKAT